MTALSWTMARRGDMRHVLVMGICGTGKSSVAAGLAERSGRPFVEADDHHDAAAVARMARGEPLSDADRWGWLDRVAEAADAAGPATVIACSALKQVYRARLARSLGALDIVHLTGPRDLIAARMAARPGHFMPVSLIDSQLADLDPPSGPGVLSLPIDRPLPELIAAAETFTIRARHEA